MTTYYGYTISPNQLETGEGFLICRNVPIARTGAQEYLGTEIGLEDAALVTVMRPEEEVFSPATLASFEGKPVTDEHPPDLLDPDTVAQFARGHAQNVRRGTGEWSDFIIADLHIQDAELIRAIQDGKREVSCGYTCDYEPNGDGTYTQKNIRGNHVAVVENGRAGHRAAIMDSINIMAASPERKQMSKRAGFLTLFGQAAQGKTVEELSKMAMDTEELLQAADAPGEGDPEVKPEEPENYAQKLYESIDGFNGKLEQLISMLTPKEPEQPEHVDEDPIEAALKEIGVECDEEAPSAEQKDEEEAVVVPAEEMDECGKDEEETKPEAMDRAAFLKAVRPAIAGIKDAAERRAVSDSIVKALNLGKGNDTAKVIDAAAKAARNNQIKTMSNEELQAIYDSRNPHTRKEN